MLGGLLAALLMPWIMAGMQSVLFITLMIVHRAWGFGRSLPQQLLTGVIGLGRGIYLFVLELVKTVRQI